MKHRFQIHRGLGVIALTFFLQACGKDNLPKYVELGALRILAMQAQNPEVTFGESIGVKPFISDLNGGNQNIKFEATGCVDPGVAYGAEPTCAGSASLQALGSGAVSFASGSSDRTGFMDEIAVVIPAQSVFFPVGGVSSTSLYNGVNYLVTLSLTADDGRQTRAFKRLVVTTRGSSLRNQNPVVSDIFSNGVAIHGILMGGSFSLQPQITVGAEIYSILKSDGSTDSKSEVLTTTWFISDGELKYYRTTGEDSTEYKGPDSSPNGRSWHLISVTRDDRGGVSIVHKTF